MNIDLPFHKSWLEDDEINEVVDTLKSGWVTTGPKTQQFEEAFQDYIGCRHAIALNSCTAGLNISLALQNFMKGDEIITTPMTFPATANVIVLNDFKPIFSAGFKKPRIPNVEFTKKLNELTYKNLATGFISQIKPVTRFL